MAKVSIIILNYKNVSDTIECINSIKKNDFSKDYSIIVVDNFSNDDSVEKLSKIDFIDLLPRKVNDGFSSGNNEGIIYAYNKYNPDFYLLLNNDTIIEKKAISKLVDASILDNSVGITTCKLLDYYNKDKIDCFGGIFNWYKMIGNFNYIYEENNSSYAYLSSGACMLIKKEVLQKVGLLCEDYFMYYEDIDYSIKVVNNGYKILVCEDSIIYHKGGASAGKASSFAIKWNTRNRIIIYKKFKNFSNGILFFTYFFFTRIIYLLKYIITFKFDYFKALIDGIKMGVTWRIEDEKKVKKIN